MKYIRAFASYILALFLCSCATKNEEYKITLDNKIFSVDMVNKEISSDGQIYN
ncbi:MAG: hypothetical protein LBV08_04280 [Clostridiales bacterium]|jgi:hypothetical protein|nr:hypothetical protein [Clostridiales bacterium]